LADVNANIDVNLNTQEALANLRNLQAGLSRFNQSLTQGNVAAMDAQKGLNQQLIQSINATGKFVASQRNVSSSTGAFTEALEKNKLSMREYFRFTAAAATANTKSLKGVFAQERDIINRARRDRVKALQTQYVQLTNANGDLVKVLQVVPKHLQMVNGRYTDYATRVQMAAQRQQFLNQLLKQGSTQLLNFGKNTQWAGRQLMVGLTVPLTMLGSYASKAFMEMEKAVIKFTRVYGDMTTSMGDTDEAVKQIQMLAKEFTKYGIAVVDTVTMAADAAAMGLTGSALTAQVTAATRLAVLGQVEQQQALETTISLQNAFGISSEELAHKINFLNAVENQTVLSIEDLTTAIPKAGPVVKQLGGSVEDLAFFMTAMKEGGINASEGANALKSGLASMINPAKKTSEFLAGLGINIKGIVDNNAGNLKATVVGLAQALDTLDPLNRARAIEQLFGKFQFSRLSTLFQNVTKDSSQASRALGLAGASVEELAILSERELGKVEDSVGIKFKKSLEDLKLQLIPIGKAFLQAITPIVKFTGKILEKFNNLGDGTKRVITTIVGVLGLVAPAALMMVGLVANGFANLIKLFAMMRNGVAKLNGQNNILGGGFDYLTQAETENLAQSNALHLTHKDLIDTFNVESGAVNALALAYTNAASQARTLASSAPGLFNTVPGPAGAVSGLPKAKKYAEGIVSVPGTGNKDTVPAMLTPGEAVVPAGIAQSPTGKAMLSALMNDNVRKYNGGTLGVDTNQTTAEELVRLNREDFVAAVSAMGPNPKSQAAIARELTEELTKAAERVGPEFADRLKEAIAHGLAELETVTAKAIENLTKQTDSVTQRPFREQYHAASATRFEDENYVFGHGAAPKAEVTDPQELLRLSTQAQRVAADGTRTDTGLSTSLRGAAENGGRAYGLSSFGFMLPEAANKRDEGGNFEMPKDEIAALFNGPNAGKTLSPIYQEWARIQGTTLEEVLKDPAQFARMQQSMESYGGILSDEISRLPENFGEEEFYGAVARANDRIAAADTQLSQAVDNLLKTTTYAVFDPNDGRGGQGNRVAVPKKSDVPLRQELGLQDEVQVGGKTVKSLQGTYQKQNTANLTVGSTIDQARADGAALGAAVIDGLRGSDGTAASSPSKKGIEAGKEVAEGLAIGMQEGQAAVTAQSERLGSAAVPRTAAETQARVDKMDLPNKAFYDDLNTPEFLEQRQILKSQDRQRRKRGATATVDSMSDTPISSQTTSLTITSSKRTADAAETLAVKTEEAATAQSQVVTQIKDESRSRIKIKGNTINIGKAREDADKAENEAAITRARAAAIEKEQAAQKARNSPTTITDEQVKAAKEKANEAELRYAEAKQKWAEAEIANAEQESSQDPVKAATDVKKDQQIISNGTQEQGDGLRRIVEGTNDTADSTTLVADKTDELVDATSETVDAQTTHADNVVTSSELANATSNNLENVVNATQQTGISQEDIANSSEEISETNDKISKEKREALRLEEEANRKKRAELGQPPLNGPIPPGSQSGNKIPSTYVDIDEALAEAYGTDTTKGFTQNKKGQIILDPETGQPTTLSEKQVLKKKRGMRREKASKFSGKAAGALGMATMVAGAVGAPPAVTGALGTAAGVAQMAPMLAGMGPVGWVVAGITAVGVGLYALNKRLQASYAAQAKFVRETSASTQKMKEIGMITGKVGASELQARKRAGGTTRDYITRERAGSSFGDTFMQSDTGKNMAKTLQANITKSGAKQAAETFATEIAAYVQDGVLTAAQAQDIAYQIGVNFKDTSLGIKIDANLAALIGPNGEDLTKDPIIIGTRLIQSAEQGSLNAVKSIDEAKSHGLSGATEAAELGARDAVAIQMAQMQADAVAKRYDDEIRTLETQLAQTKNKEAQVKLEDKLRALKEKANDAEFQMNNLVANQVDNSMERFTKEIQHQSVVWDAVTFGLYKLWGAGNQREAAYTQSLNAAVTDKYANTEQATQAATVSDRLAKFADGKTLGFGTNNYEDAGFVGGKEAQQFEVKMKLLMANGTLTPNQTTAMLDLFEGNLPQLETVLDIGTRMHGASGTAELLMMLTNFQDKTYAQDIAFEITTKDNDTFKKLSDIIGLASWLDGKEIDMEVVIKNAGGVAGLEYYIAKLDELETKIKELKGKPITQDDVAKFTKDTDVKVTDKYLDYVNKEFKGDSKKQTNAIRTYTLIYDQIMSMDYTSEAAKKYFEAQAGQIALEKLQALDKAGTAPDDFKTYLTQQTKLEIDALITKVKVDPSAVATDKAITAIGIKPIVDPNAGGPVKTPGGGKADNPLDFLDALAMRIKMIRDQSFKATKPIESMLAAFRSKAAQKDVSNMFKLFDGLQQRLIALKAPKEFRDHIAGLDAKGLEALKNRDADPTKAGKQSMFTYETKKVKGKTVVDKSRIAGFSEAGKAFMAAYNEAPLAEFNVEQAETIQNTNNQYKAFAMLKAQGVDTAKALDAVSNAAVAAALTSGLLAKTDLDKYIADIKTSNDALQKQAVINDLLAKNSAMEFAEKSMPQLASAMKASGYSAEQIAKVLEDPNLAKQLIEDLNDGKVDSKAISDYLNNIKKEKFVEIKGKV
jgi:TP901 family phage tail tape measure protein